MFYGDNNATVYYLPGTTGWGTTFDGRPTALWVKCPPSSASQTQTAEAGSAVDLWVDASSPLPLFYLWCLDNTNLMSWSTNCDLELTNVQFSQSGAYTVVISNVLGTATSGPAMLNVIEAVERRPVPGVKVTGQTASLLNVDYADSLSLAPNWTTLGSVSLTSASQYYFDLTLPLPPQRFYRAWQTGTPGVIPSVDLHLVPAITLTGNIGDAWRLDAINQFGPTDAWFTLDTVTLTNTSQLYFDTSAWGQPQRQALPAGSGSLATNKRGQYVQSLQLATHPAMHTAQYPRLVVSNAAAMGPAIQSPDQSPAGHARCGHIREDGAGCADFVDSLRFTFGYCRGWSRPPTGSSTGFC